MQYGRDRKGIQNMADFSGMTFSEGMVEYTIHEQLAVLDRYEDREVPWAKEVNIVSWKGGQPKIDIRDWSQDHTRMSIGITLTEEQAKKLTAALTDRYREMAKQPKMRAERYSLER